MHSVNVAFFNIVGGCYFLVIFTSVWGGHKWDDILTERAVTTTMLRNRTLGSGGGGRVRWGHSWNWLMHNLWWRWHVPHFCVERRGLFIGQFTLELIMTAFQFQQIWIDKLLAQRNQYLHKRVIICALGTSLGFEAIHHEVNLRETDKIEFRFTCSCPEGNLKYMFDLSYSPSRLQKAIITSL